MKPLRSLFFIALAFACQQSPSADDPAPPRAILSVLMHRLGVEDRPNVFVLDSTVPFPSYGIDWILQTPWADSVGRPLVEAALADLRRHGTRRWPLPRGVVRSLGARPVHGDVPTGTVGGYSPMFIMVSALGTDSAGRVAAVYVEHYCGLLCGGGTMSFFIKGRDGAWSYAHSENIFFS